MRIDVSNLRVALLGEGNSVTASALAALAENGASVVAQDAEPLPDIVLCSLPLLAEPAFDSLSPRVEAVGAIAARMFARGSGRIVFVLSAAAGLPMRRHPQQSAALAAAIAGMRGLAMQFGPHVLVNALGLGAIGAPLVAGDAGMLSHVAVGRAGRIEEAVAGLLFLCDPANSYTTGQLLNVDGGWSVGYGRNF